MSTKKKPVVFDEPFTRRFVNWKPGPCKTACEKELRSLMNEVEAAIDGNILHDRAGIMQIFDEQMKERGMYPSI